MGEVMAMNVATPEHLRAIGLLPAEKGDEETERQAMINFLLFQVRSLSLSVTFRS